MQKIVKCEALLNWHNFFLFFMLILLLPAQLQSLPGTDVDSSWMIALNLAVSNGFIFGKNFIFTYGPLGFLYTHIGLEIPYGYVWIFLFDLSIISAILFIINTVVKEYNSLIVYGLVVIIVYHLAYADTTNRILVIVIFFLIQNIKKTNFYSLAVVSLFLVIQFFIKPSAAIFFIAIFTIAAFYIAIFKADKLAFAYPFGLALLIILLSIVLNVNITGYLSSAIELSTTYSDTMNLLEFTKLRTALFLLFAVSVILTFFTISLITIFKARNLDTILISGIVLLCIYYLFKHGYVRSDGGHLRSFWSTVLCIVFIFLYHTFHLSGKLSRILYIFILFIFIPAFSYLSKFVGGRYSFPFPIISYINELYTPLLKNTILKSTIESKNLPDSIHKIIGSNTIDVMPYDIAIIYFNRLNYHPRPVIASYLASSTSLNVLNCNHYKSLDASEFILFNNGSGDDRYPFWDESLTKQVLISIYEPLGSLFTRNGKIDTLFLLKKREIPLNIKEKIITDTSFIFNTKFSIPKTDDLIYLSAEIKYSNWGKLLKFLYQPPIIYIRLFYDNGSSGLFRLILPEIEHGVVINKKLITNNDAYLLFNYQGRRNERITSFIILPENNAYKPSFRIKLTKHAYLP
jgi:hypothetical protein